MKNILLLFSAGFVLITATSCEKNESLFGSTETRLQGEWCVDKVLFSPNLSFNQLNITNQYSGLIYTFSEGNNVVLSNTANGETATGSYRVETEWQYYGDDNYQNAEMLNGTLVDFTNQEVTILFWRNLNVGRKKITATEQFDDGTYSYTLVRN
jgi:hypothetical protein